MAKERGRQVQSHRLIGYALRCRWSLDAQPSNRLCPPGTSIRAGGGAFTSAHNNAATRSKASNHRRSGENECTIIAASAGRGCGSQRELSTADRAVEPSAGSMYYPPDTCSCEAGAERRAADDSNTAKLKHMI